MSTRKVWVGEVPKDYEYQGPCGYEVLIEQFDDRPPTVAFRPTDSFGLRVWAAPVQTEER